MIINCMPMHTNSDLSHNSYCNSRSVLSRICKICNPMASNQQADVHFRYGYNINIMPQSACLVETQSWFISMVSSLIAQRWVRPQTQ